MTPQEQIAAKLAESGIPAKEIKCYGSQVMITAYGLTSGGRWYRLLKRFCTTVRGPIESRDFNEVNRGTCLMPTVHRVYRVWGTI